jgi:hypothetical protein
MTAGSSSSSMTILIADAGEGAPAAWAGSIPGVPSHNSPISQHRSSVT